MLSRRNALGFSFLAGLALIVAGVCQLSVPAGLIIGGVLTSGFGWLFFGEVPDDEPAGEASS